MANVTPKEPQAGVKSNRVVNGTASTQTIHTLLEQYRAASQTEREKGTYFEELIRTYLYYEPTYRDLYSDVWLYSDWGKKIGGPQFGLSAKDTGIDLVAKTAGTDEYMPSSASATRPIIACGRPTLTDSSLHRGRSLSPSASSSLRQTILARTQKGP